VRQSPEGCRGWPVPLALIGTVAPVGPPTRRLTAGQSEAASVITVSLAQPEVARRSPQWAGGRPRLESFSHGGNSPERARPPLASVHTSTRRHLAPPQCWQCASGWRALCVLHSSLSRRLRLSLSEWRATVTDSARSR
jgi:hypothetical protein